MNSTDPSYFPPPFPAADHPLSIRGRFGRLSFIAWSAFLQFIFLCSSIALGLSIDIVNIASLSVNSNWQVSLHGLSSLFALAIMLVYLYFGIVITVRRLHDLDRSGWWMLLFFVPLINLFVWIYILLFPGTRGSNQYGPIRTSLVWEKIVAWLVIIFTVLSLLATTALFSYMSEGEPLRIPSEVKQKTTEFF